VRPALTIAAVLAVGVVVGSLHLVEMRTPMTGFYRWDTPGIVSDAIELRPNGWVYAWFRRTIEGRETWVHQAIVRNHLGAVRFKMRYWTVGRTVRFVGLETEYAYDLDGARLRFLWGRTPEGTNVHGRGPDWVWAGITVEHVNAGEPAGAPHAGRPPQRGGDVTLWMD